MNEHRKADVGIELDGLCSRVIDAYEHYPLLPMPDGTVLDIARGYMPLLVNFTHEDKAAKGLRSLKEQSEAEPLIYFSALEMVRDTAALLLAGETGSGKTAFAIHLALELARTRGTLPVSLEKPVVRNDTGTVLDESWQMPDVVPLYLPLDNEDSFAGLLGKYWPQGEGIVSAKSWTNSASTLLVIIDGIEKAGDAGLDVLHQALAFQKAHERIRLLILGEASTVKGWALPVEFVRYDLLPLLRSQRLALSETADILGVVALSPVAANPAQFAMALGVDQTVETAEQLADVWLGKVARDHEAEATLCRLSFDLLAGDAMPNGEQANYPQLLGITRVRQLLAARYLMERRATDAVELFRKNGNLWAPVLRSLAVRLGVSGKSSEPLIDALVSGFGDDALRGALLAADLLDEPSGRRTRVAALLLQMISDGALSAPQREKAGRILSRWGDPRDLLALADIPAGEFTFGSNTHPNSAPPHTIVVEAFRMGMYPVTNGEYGVFVREAGWLWRSPDGFDEDRRNAPATDLTWRDARAYCDWLTARWRADGRISEDETVRLPTEPEWERASRGDQPDEGRETIIYPWGPDWLDDAANSEEAGFNNTCAVGLFPKGRSPFGCYDMAGQIWEWATTLWGADMATPHFKYPYRNDGREALDAGSSIRRVLRGGCFSSGKLKACCTYRGSLEPDGFWRGNGFRIAVSKGP